MSKKLSNLVKIVENTVEYVLLEILPQSKLELMKLGFGGDEEYIRVAKGAQKVCTIWRKDSYITFDWGNKGYTVLSEGLQRQQQLIVACLTGDLDIYIDEDLDLRKRSCHTKMSDAPKSHIIAIQFNYDRFHVEKDAKFYGTWASMDDIIKHFTSIGFLAPKLKGKTRNRVGNIVSIYEITRAPAKNTKKS